MSTVIEAQAPVAPGSPEDPYRLGWRWVRQMGPGGAESWAQVPLTEEDLLHPQEEDFLVQLPAHDRDCYYLKGALQEGAAHLPGAVVLHDERTDFQVPGIEPLGPDLGVYSGVAGAVTQGTFRVADMGGHPELVVEVTSPSTRGNDFGAKVGLYFQVGVPLYVIVDHREDRGAVEVIGHRATPQGYVRMQPDERGRLWLGPVRLWLAIEGGQAVCYDEQGNRIPEYHEARQQTREARRRVEEVEAEKEEEARARQKAEADKGEEARARRRLEAEKAQLEAEKEEEARARQKAEADKEAEARARRRLEAEKAQLEAEKEEEARARQKAEADKEAEARARRRLEAEKGEEARARQKAEADKEAEARARRRLEAEKAEAEADKEDLAARLRQMEAELRRLRGDA